MVCFKRPCKVYTYSYPDISQKRLTDTLQQQIKQLIQINIPLQSKQEKKGRQINAYLISYVNYATLLINSL